MVPLSREYYYKVGKRDFEMRCNVVLRGVCQLFIRIIIVSLLYQINYVSYKRLSLFWAGLFCQCYCKSFYCVHSCPSLQNMSTVHSNSMYCSVIC